MPDADETTEQKQMRYPSYKTDNAPSGSSCLDAFDILKFDKLEPEVKDRIFNNFIRRTGVLAVVLVFLGSLFGGFIVLVTLTFVGAASWWLWLSWFVAIGVILAIVKPILDSRMRSACVEIGYCAMCGEALESPCGATEVHCDSCGTDWREA